MRILLAIHHPLDPNQGAPGVTLALGRALASLGCEVAYYDYREAFPGVTTYTAGHGLKFPWRLAGWLARRARNFDVLDVTTGDAWPWARMGRPGAKVCHALVTRSHGLEHVMSERFRADAQRGLLQLSWKYPLYHGGFRLWEVQQSLRVVDHSVLLNAQDAAYARERLGISGQRLAVIPHGLDLPFLGRPLPEPGAPGPLRVAFVGSWLPLKGREVLVSVAAELAALGVDFRLALLGTGFSEEEVLRAFPASVRKNVRVVPRYSHAQLPSLLEHEEVFLFPSHTEGFGMALVEAMACGLAPVSTPVGVAPDVIREGVSGHLVPVADGHVPVARLTVLAENREMLLSFRRRARDAVQGMSWEGIAKRTLALYEEVLRRR